MNEDIYQKKEEVVSDIEQNIKRFIEASVNPFALQRHLARESIPKAVFQEAADLGLLSYKFPESVGGGGKGDVSWGLLLEELGYICEDNSFPMLLSYYTGVAEDIFNIKDGSLTEDYVKPMLASDILGVFAYTEDADHFSLKSRATLKGDECVINGVKPFISGGDIADIFMTYILNENNELQVFLVHRNDPGVEVHQRDVVGFRSGGICSLELKDVRIPKERAIVTADGLSHGQRYLNTRRVFLACGFLGRMRAILERCVLMMDGTRRYERPLSEFPNVQAAIGRMTILYETARSCIYRALEHMASGRANPAFDTVYSTAKYVVAHNGRQLIDIAMHIVGGRGYLEANAYGRDLADFCALISGAGTQDLLEVNIGMIKTNEVALRERLRARQ